MYNKKYKVILALITFLIIGCVYYSIKLYNKPHINVKETASNIITTPNTLLGDFFTNETLSNKKYLDQIIQFSGEISNLDLSNGKGVVVFKGNNGNIRCYLSASENKKITTLKKGQNISIKGICTGYLLDIIMIKCVIINF